MKDLWIVLIDTGLRMGEALALLPKDCDFRVAPNAVNYAARFSA
jgi:integrase